MKKSFLLFFILCMPFLYASAQKNISMELYAGSNASWGYNQHLFIDAKGNCRYILTEVNKGVKDSSSFKLTQSQLNELNAVVQRVSFFGLDGVYKTNAVDGDALYIKITSAGKSHEVSLTNKHIKEMDEILDKVNELLSLKKIKINY